MRANEGAAAALQEYAELFALCGGDAFRVRSYQKAAKAIAGFPEDISVVDVRSVPGVGEAIGSFRGGLVFVASNIAAGSEEGWSICWSPAAVDAVEPLYDAAFDMTAPTPPGRMAVLGFNLAKNAMPIGSVARSRTTAGAENLRWMWKVPPHHRVRYIETIPKFE